MISKWLLRGASETCSLSRKVRALSVDVLAPDNTEQLTLAPKSGHTSASGRCCEKYQLRSGTSPTPPSVHPRSQA